MNICFVRTVSTISNGKWIIQFDCFSAAHCPGGWKPYFVCLCIALCLILRDAIPEKNDRRHEPFPRMTHSIYNCDQFIFGNEPLHLQLSTALAVMSELIVNPARPRTALDLSVSMDISIDCLRHFLRVLTNGNLVEVHDERSDTWLCARPANAISLCDIYQCVIASEEQTRLPVLPLQKMPGLDLLMMQASMSINQIVMQNLQRFDLGRLKVMQAPMAFAASPRLKARDI